MGQLISTQSGGGDSVAEAQSSSSIPPRHHHQHHHMRAWSSAQQQSGGGKNNVHRIEELARIKGAEERRQHALKSNTHDKTKENQQLLKKLFNRLDPSVTKMDTEVQGEIQVSFKCDLIREQILVKVIKCRDLGVNSITGKTADPFVAIAMFPDNENQGVKQTTVSSKSQNPVFNEIFAFHIDEVGLVEGKVVLQVIDQDLVYENEFMGETIINLADFDFQTESVHTAWYSLKPETDLTITGELDVRLTYTYPQALSVTVLRAHGLRGHDRVEKINPFIKIGAPGMEDVHVTEVRVNDCNPVWDETYIFQIPEEEFSFRYIVFTVLNEDGSNDTDTLGHVVIDLDQFDPETGFEGTFSLTDMSNSDRLKSKWFQTTTVQEFKEALWAHSAFSYPKLLFQSNHSGNKVVRLTCRKAGAKAKLSLVNGIPVV